MRYLALIILGLFATDANAQAICKERGELVDKLKSDYAEIPVSRGLTAKGAEMVEVLASERGTFSILLTKPDGESCLMAAGDSWHDTPQKDKGGI